MELLSRGCSFKLCNKVDEIGPGYIGYPWDRSVFVGLDVESEDPVASRHVEGRLYRGTEAGVILSPASRNSGGKSFKTMPRKRAKKRAILPWKAGMKRWEYEVSHRGKKIEGVWWWSYDDVSTFCRRPEWVKAYLTSGYKKGVVYYQILYYSLTKKYIHHTRRKLMRGALVHQNVRPGLDYTSMTGYKKMLRDKCKEFFNM